MKTVKIAADELKTLELVANAVSEDLCVMRSLWNLNLECGMIVGCGLIMPGSQKTRAGFIALELFSK